MVDYIYPDFNDVLKNKSYTPLIGGYHSVVLVDLGDKSVVYKFLNDNTNSNIRHKVKKILHSIESPIRNYYVRLWHESFKKHVAPVFKDESLSIEHITLEEWKKIGIPCMPVLEKQEKALIYNYFNSINFKKIITTSNRPNFQYKQLLDIISQIRNAAITQDNPMLLHSDLLPQNFLYLLDENKTIAIDPGVKLSELPLDELDARLNLDFMYGLMISKNSSEYINSFLDILNKKDIQLIREFNKPLTKHVTMYFRMRSKILSVVRNNKIEFIETYSPKNTKYINKLLDRHLT
ncbi:MAG: hypothetical protein ACP5N1_06760 [Candidatus Woesearchaeota archaeon]